MPYTYSIIINNIKRFCESFPNTKVSIRINVDKNVSPKFVEICREIRREINVKHRYNLNIYPGILKATGKVVIPVSLIVKTNSNSTIIC